MKTNEVQIIRLSGHVLTLFPWILPELQRVTSVLEIFSDSSDDTLLFRVTPPVTRIKDFWVIRPEDSPWRDMFEDMPEESKNN